jgi:RNA polymerase sigma factor (sigma-70 family)
VTPASEDRVSVQQLDEMAMRRLLRRCAALAGPDAAEDVAQETLVAALRSHGAPDSREELDAWLAGVARNVARRHWRARTREVPLADVAIELAAPREAEADGPELREELIHRALARMAPAGRSLVAARLLGGQSTSAMATRLGLSPAALSMRLTRARAEFRRVLVDELGEEARAAGIRVRGGGWRPTPLWCTECGAQRLEVRRTAAQVAFRCAACASHPGEVGSAFALRNRTFAGLFDRIAQPAAVARRAAAWSHDYFSRPGHSGQAPCTACGRLARMLPYRRTAPDLALRHRVGLHVRCAACRETVSTSLGGLVASRPEALQLRERAGRVRATETVPTQVDGRAALVAGQRALRGSAAIEVVVAADTLRLLSVRTTT